MKAKCKKEMEIGTNPYIKRYAFISINFKL